MKPIFIIGNWKSHKTVDQAKEWLYHFERMSNHTTALNRENLEVILCVSFIHLYPLKRYLDRIRKKLSMIKLGAQNVSPFSEGSYTGEISAKMLCGLVDYCLVGHSERRNFFGETDELIAKKIKQLSKLDIKPILCVQGPKTPIPDGTRLIAYEPTWAIGSGKPATAKHANEIAERIKDKRKNAIIIYGGSVTPENVAEFLRKPNINGVLPGGASLDSSTFAKIIIHANKGQ